MATLKDCCSLLIDGDWIESKDQSKSGIRLVQTGNVGNGEYLEKPNRAKYISEDTFSSLQCTEVFPGDILISRLPDPVGRACLIPEKEERMITAVDCSILRVNESLVDKRYLLFFLCSQQYFSQLTEKLAGTTRVRVSRKNLEKVELSIPAKDKQLHIVEVLTSVNAVKKAREKELSALDDLIKARFVEMFGEPIANPMNWPVKRLKELSTLITNGNTPKGGSENYVEDGKMFLRSQNVWRNRIELDDVAYIDEATHNSMRKSSLRHKDILITKTGRINTENSSLGRAALFLGTDDSANINGHVYLVRLNGAIVPEFVVTILTGEAYRRYIRKVCVGGIDKRQINLDQVEDFPIIMPPYEQQMQFVTFAAQVDKSKAAIQKSLDETQKLFDCLMQQYFG